MAEINTFDAHDNSTITATDLVTKAPVIAGKIAVSVTGAIKVEAAHNALCPLPISNTQPASLINPTDSTLTWVLDGDAATLLWHANFNTN